MTSSSEYKGAVFFDIDGTLIDMKNNINTPPESAAKAIAELKENGYLVGIATGRAEEYIPNLGLDLNCVVSCNGSIVKVDGEIVFNQAVPPEASAAVIEYFNNHKLFFLVETIHGCYYCGEPDDTFAWLRTSFRHISEYPEDIENLRVNKMCAPYVEGIIDEFKEKFGSDLYIIRQRHSDLMDMGAAGVSKAAGICAALDRFGVDIENSYAFGDDTNDIEMLTAVGHGIAMTPHVPDLDGIAEYVTSGVTDDGIYNGLRHFGLVK